MATIEDARQELRESVLGYKRASRRYTLSFCALFLVAGMFFTMLQYDVTVLWLPLLAVCLTLALHVGLCDARRVEAKLRVRQASAAFRAWKEAIVSHPELVREVDQLFGPHDSAA